MIVDTVPDAARLDLWQAASYNRILGQWEERGDWLGSVTGACASRLQSRKGRQAMGTGPQDWLDQADYDMDTADYMFAGERYFYAVFMCHLSLEKALKGLYQARLGKVPPKTHNLVRLLNDVALTPGGELARFFVRLNEAQIITRYPEHLDVLRDNYTRTVVGEILAKGKEAAEWIRHQF